MKYQAPFGATDPNAAYVNADFVNGVEGSIPNAEAIEHPMREIIEVITNAGLTPDATDLTQLRQAIVKIIGDAVPESEKLGALALLDNLNGLSIADTIGNIDASRILNLVIPSSTPAGAVLWYAAPTVPTEFLKCNGALISRVSYGDLFGVIGTAYGAGDGSSTFALPDLRGEFIRGFDDGRGIDSGRSFGSTQADELKSHRHITPYIAADEHTSAASAGVSDSNYECVTNGKEGNEYNRYSYYTGGTETRPRNIALLPIIKY